MSAPERERIEFRWHDDCTGRGQDGRSGSHLAVGMEPSRRAQRHILYGHHVPPRDFRPEIGCFARVSGTRFGRLVVPFVATTSVTSSTAEETTDVRPLTFLSETVSSASASI